MADAIVVTGVREHNLKNITVEIPRLELPRPAPARQPSWLPGTAS